MLRKSHDLPHQPRHFRQIQIRNLVNCVIRIPFGEIFTRRLSSIQFNHGAFESTSRACILISQTRRFSFVIPPILSSFSFILFGVFVIFQCLEFCSCVCFDPRTASSFSFPMACNSSRASRRSLLFWFRDTLCGASFSLFFKIAKFLFAFDFCSSHRQNRPLPSCNH